MKNGLLNKIFVSGLFIFLIISLIIALAGIKGPIQLDNTYYNFMQRVALEYSSWKIEIPDIPKIPQYDDLIGVLDFLVRFVNILITIINILSLIINKVIEVILFIVALIKLLVQWKSLPQPSSGDIHYWSALVSCL